MNYFMWKFVCQLVIHIWLCKIYEFHDTTYHADKDVGERKWSKSFHHVHSAISCGVICASEMDVCQSWYYNGQIKVCQILTDTNKMVGSNTESSDNSAWEHWSMVQAPPVFCRVPFEKLSIHGLSGRVENFTQCEANFCFFETNQTADCRRTGNWKQSCGICKKVKWTKETAAGDFGGELPSPIRAGWELIWKGTVFTGFTRFEFQLSPVFLMDVYVNAHNGSVSVQAIIDKGNNNKDEVNKNPNNFTIQRLQPFEIKFSVYEEHFVVRFDNEPILKLQVSSKMFTDKVRRLSIIGNCSVQMHFFY